MALTIGLPSIYSTPDTTVVFGTKCLVKHVSHTTKETLVGAFFHFKRI